MNIVYILIVNWNGTNDTIECLESILRLKYDNYKIVICDNGSSDDFIEKIFEWNYNNNLVNSNIKDKYCTYIKNNNQYCDELRNKDIKIYCITSRLIVLRSQENLGFAGGNNIGLNYIKACGDYNYVWILNNDTVVDINALSALVSRMKQKTSAGMCGSTLVYYDNRNRIQARAGGWYCRWIGLPWHIGQLQKVSETPNVHRVEYWMNYVVGASMLITKEFIDNVGLMCEDYFLYYEELDWALRAKGKFTLAYAPQSIVYHKVGRSIGTSADPRRKSKLSDYYAIRNRLYFTRKYFPYCRPFIYFSVFFAFLVRLTIGQCDRAVMIWNLLCQDIFANGVKFNGKTKNKN